MHLWHGRRASTRVRSQLMAAIYTKALMRKDYSGIVEKKEPTKGGGVPTTSGMGTAAAKKIKDKVTGAKNTSGADIGKIVNLMSADTTRLMGTVIAAFFLYVHCPVFFR